MKTKIIYNILILLGCEITITAQTTVTSKPVCGDNPGMIVYHIDNLPQEVERPFTIRYKKSSEEFYDFIETNLQNGEIKVREAGTYEVLIPTNHRCLDIYSVSVESR